MKVVIFAGGLGAGISGEYHLRPGPITDEFIINKDIDHKLLLSAAPDRYLKRVK